MSSVGAGGHLLIPAAIRGSNAAVKAEQRRVADPHSIAFSCTTHLQKQVFFNRLLCETNVVRILYPSGWCLSTKARRRDGWMMTACILPLGGMGGMTQASFCPSETSVCRILATRCVQRCQGQNYNFLCIFIDWHIYRFKSHTGLNLGKPK